MATNPADAILAALNVLFEPGQITELRALEVSTRTYRRPHTVSGYFDDMAKLAAEAARISPFAKGVYVILNPINPALLARSANRVRDVDDRDSTTSDNDVLSRRWLMIDTDPIRPAGISSSESEHEASLARAGEIREALREEGWPEPILADSGNGAHLLYRVDLPAADEGLIKRALEALAFRFDDKVVQVDQKVYNPARIWKLYGTISRKGDNVPARPHRTSQLIDAPTLLPVTEHFIKTLTSCLPPVELPTVTRTSKGEPFNLDYYISEHGLNVTGPYQWQNGRKWIFRVCPWNPDHRNRSAWLIQQPSGAIAAGCQHNSCSGNNWHALRDLLEPGWQDRRNGHAPKLREIRFEPVETEDAETESDGEPTPNEEEIVNVHLAQSASSDLVGKKVEVKVLCAGKLDAPYIVPKRMRYICYANEKERVSCGAVADPERNAGHWDRVLDDQSSVFIELCHKRNEQLKRILQAAAGCQPTCKKFGYEILDHVNVEQILAVPMANKVLPVTEDNGRHRKVKELDETGNEYVARNLYLLNASATINQYYRLTGRVYPHPDTQLGTILIPDITPMQDNIEQFQMTPEIQETFKVFQADSDEKIVEHVEVLLEDLTNNVTHIYKRDRALLAVLLAYHSILNFEFEERPIRRGWLEVLLLGDTGLGKTEVTRSLMDFCGLGALVSGETATRTGLTYAIEQVGERWFVKWGKYPLNDRRLLAIDELSELSEDDLGKMTQGRNDGILRVDRAGVGEANCRTRLVWMSNPRWGKGLYNFSHGIEALKSLFPADADLRRLDLAVFLAKRDIDLSEINQLRSKPKRQIISSEALRQSVLWAWSRKSEDVVIDTETTKEILTEASKLSDKYGVAEDISLVSPADMRNKLARLAVAFASLVHSTDEEHCKVAVKPIHVQFVSAYLDEVYSAENCRYDIYAGYAAQQSRLDDAEIEAIKGELNITNTKSLIPDTTSQEILDLYRRNDVLSVTEIADMLDIDRRTVTSRTKILQKHMLIKKTRHGLHKTPKFVEYLSKADKQAVYK